MKLLRRGMKGEAVRYLQTMLTAQGFGIKVDGDFGAKTDNAVRTFQASVKHRC